MLGGGISGNVNGSVFFMGFVFYCGVLFFVNLLFVVNVLLVFGNMLIVVFLVSDKLCDDM